MGVELAGSEQIAVENFIQGNLEKAKRYTEYALKCGTAPVVPHFYALCLNDDTFPDHMLLGLGIMLAANEVPRIAQQFGLDSSVKVNMMSVVHATTTAVNLTRSVARATGK